MAFSPKGKAEYAVNGEQGMLDAPPPKGGGVLGWFNLLKKRLAGQAVLLEDVA